MPSSGLPPAADRVAIPAPARSKGPASNAEKWSPPVVPLLVDPWASAPEAPAVGGARWLAAPPEIVDPWAKKARGELPRVASSRSPRATIF